MCPCNPADKYCSALFHPEETMHMLIFASYCWLAACWCSVVQYEHHLMKHPWDKCHVHHRMATLWWSLLPWSAEEDYQKSPHLCSTVKGKKHLDSEKKMYWIFIIMESMYFYTYYDCFYLGFKRGTCMQNWWSLGFFSKLTGSCNMWIVDVCEN